MVLAFHQKCIASLCFLQVMWIRPDSKISSIWMWLVLTSLHPIVCSTLFTWSHEASEILQNPVAAKLHIPSSHHCWSGLVLSCEASGAFKQAISKISSTKHLNWFFSQLGYCLQVSSGYLKELRNPPAIDPAFKQLINRIHRSSMFHWNCQQGTRFLLLQENGWLLSLPEPRIWFNDGKAWVKAWWQMMPWWQVMMVMVAMGQWGKMTDFHPAWSYSRAKALCLSSSESFRSGQSGLPVTTASSL